MVDKTNRQTQNKQTTDSNAKNSRQNGSVTNNGQNCQPDGCSSK